MSDLPENNSSEGHKYPEEHKGAEGHKHPEEYKNVEGHKHPAGFIKKRKHARDKAMQALYQLHVSKEEIDWVRDHYLADQGVSSGDEEYFIDLLYGVNESAKDIDAEYHPYMTSMENNIDPIEQSILRIATYEFLKHVEIPFKVVINEALNLAKTYGADDSHKFINGVLDPLSKKLRPLEVKAAQ